MRISEWSSDVCSSDLLRLSRQAIHAANAWYAPGLKAVGSRSLASWDEDPITMAMAAGRDCLAVSHAQPDLSGVYLASNTLPFADRLNAGVIAAALGLNEAMDRKSTRLNSRH